LNPAGKNVKKGVKSRCNAARRLFSVPDDVMVVSWIKFSVIARHKAAYAKAKRCAQSAQRFALGLRGLPRENAGHSWRGRLLDCFTLRVRNDDRLLATPVIARDWFAGNPRFFKLFSLFSRFLRFSA
jgi:hypothetical protein